MARTSDVTKLAALRYTPPHIVARTGHRGVLPRVDRSNCIHPRARVHAGIVLAGEIGKQFSVSTDFKVHDVDRSPQMSYDVLAVRMKPYIGR
jgi:hypothetical protein